MTASGLWQLLILSLQNPQNVRAGCRVTGLQTYNMDIFLETNFAPSYITENSCQDLALPGPSTNAVIPALNASPSSPGLSTSPAIPGFSTDPVAQGRSTSQAIAGPSKQAITSPIGGHATSINILTPHNSRYYPRPVHEISLSVEREREKREKNCNSH